MFFGITRRVLLINPCVVEVVEVVVVVVVVVVMLVSIVFGKLKL